MPIHIDLTAPDDPDLGIGRIVSLAEDPQDPDILYLGSETGGLYKYSQVTQNSTPLNTDQLERLGVAEIAVDPSNSDRIWIATGQAEGIYSSNPISNKNRSCSGIYLSTNAGASFDISLAWDEVLTKLFEKFSVPYPHLKLVSPDNNWLECAKILIKPSNPDEIIVFFVTKSINGLIPRIPG